MFKTITLSDTLFIEIYIYGGRMIIDIDIKIAQSNGKLIHSFSKRFNEKLEVSEKIEKNTGLSKEFEDFLAEYLTASGRLVRDRLITDIPELLSNDTFPADSISGGNEPETAIADSEMEYKIRIGNNRVIAGRIPFLKLKRINTVTDAIETANRDFEVTDPKKASGIGDSPGFSSIDFESRKKDIARNLEKNLKSLMIQAVEKYESNFYHIQEEEKAEF